VFLFHARRIPCNCSHSCEGSGVREMDARLFPPRRRGYSTTIRREHLMPRFCRPVFLIVAVSAWFAPVAGRAQEKATEHRNGVVVAVSPAGADVGVAILKQGGNAVDAAVATAFALAVTYPAAGNIGGGGFMLVHPARGKGEPVVFEYRETAPAAATKDMFKPGASPH